MSYILKALFLIVGVWIGVQLGRWEDKQALLKEPNKVISVLVVFGCATYEGTVFTLSDGSQVSFDPTEKSEADVAPAIEALANQGHAGIIHTPCAADDPDVPHQNKTARF